MLIVTPPSVRNQVIWADALPPEHLLERISILEMRLLQVTERLSQVLDLMLRQSRTVQSEHLLVETLFEQLSASGIVEGDKLAEIWRSKKTVESDKEKSVVRYELLQEKTLDASTSSKIDVSTRLIKDGFQLIKNGDEKQGIRTLERAAAHEPKNVILLGFIGEFYFRQDKRDDAREFLQKAHRLDAANAKIGLPLGIILADEGDIAAAQKILEPLSKANNFVANFILGVLAATENNLNSTLAAFKSALDAKPCAETFYLVGSVYAEMKREKTAFKHLRKAVELDQNFADAWFTLGAIYLRLGDEANAKNAMNKSRDARDANAQAQAVLRNPQKYHEIADTTLFFSRLRQVKKNFLNHTSPRLAKLLRDELEIFLNAE